MVSLSLSASCINSKKCNVSIRKIWLKRAFFHNQRWLDSKFYIPIIRLHRHGNMVYNFGIYLYLSLNYWLSASVFDRSQSTVQSNQSIWPSNHVCTVRQERPSDYVYILRLRPSMSTPSLIRFELTEWA